jgi:hypothetical protein
LFGWVEYSVPFYLCGLPDGEYLIDYYSIDNVGNVEPTKTTTVILDMRALAMKSTCFAFFSGEKSHIQVYGILEVSEVVSPF